MMLKKQTVWLLTMLSLVVVLSVYYIMSPDDNLSAPVDNVEEGKQAVEEKAPAEDKGDVQDTEEKGTTDEQKGTTEEEPMKEEEGKEGKEGKDTSKEDSEEGAEVTTEASDDAFTNFRLSLQDKRSKQKEDYNEIAMSDEATAEEKSEAVDMMKKLDDEEITEETLETLIKTEGYGDAFVVASGNDVNVTVRAKEHSKTAVIKIVDLVQKETGQDGNVNVAFEPEK